MKKHDVIIVGGGPGGSTLAAYLAKAGFDIGLFERETFPRFHIGESLLPSTMPIFKETGFFETLNSGKYLRKYGARFVDYRTEDEVYFGFEDGFNTEIPMAFEVERSQFDRDLLEHARKCGATIYQPDRVKNIEFFDTHVIVSTNSGDYQALYIADSTGRDSILGKQFKLRVKNDDLNNVAVFSHFNGVQRFTEKNEGDIVIGILPENSWAWVIPFKGEKTSVGVVCHSEQFKNSGGDLAAYMENYLNTSSRLKTYMEHSERVSEVTVISNYSHHCETYAGDRWILIGDSAVFLDPIFSSGVHVACTSAKLASQCLTQALKNKTLLTENHVSEKYKSDLDKGVKRFHALISLFYKTNFVDSMKKTQTRENTRKAFTSAVAGDMWNDDNFIFQMKVL